MGELTPVNTAQFGKSRMLCWGILLASGIVYGSSFSFMKIAVAKGANPLGMVFWFAMLAACVLGVEMTAMGKIHGLDFGLLKFCMPWGILSVVVPNLCFFYAAKIIQASIIAMGIALVPLLTLAGAILLGREKPTVRRLAGIALGGISAMMVLLPKASLPHPGDAAFVAIAFAGALCYAAEHLYIDARAPKHVSVDQLLFLMFSSVLLILLPIVIITGTFVRPNWPLGTTELATVAVAGVTLLDYFLITLLILWTGPVFTSQAAYVVTLAGIGWGIVFFHDSHSAWIWAAVGGLMLGLTLVRPRFGERHETPQQQS